MNSLYYATHTKRALGYALILALGFAVTPCAHATENGRLTIIEENDRFTTEDDQHYTQGLRFSYLSPSLKPDSGFNGAFDSIASISPFFGTQGSSSRHTNWIIGQSIFTPQNTRRGTPDPTDRPYAGWLYAGVGLIQDNDSRSLDHVELLLGVVGPSAGGRQTQNDFHSFIGDNKARGWSRQLRDEPGVAISADHIWRFNTPLGVGGLEAEVLPQVGATVGNVMTYADAGAVVRIGHNLKANYGQSQIRPGISGTDYFNADKLSDKFGYAIYAGTEGRAVGRNVFLDGSTFHDNSPSVDKNTLVADFVVGASLFWSDDVKLDFTAVQRTPEFDGQRGIDRFGGINLSFGL